MQVGNGRILYQDKNGNWVINAVSPQGSRMGIGNGGEGRDWIVGGVMKGHGGGCRYLSSEMEEEEEE